MLGDLGEETACAHLQSLGQKILDRNWTSGHLELDIVTLASDGLHFVEVKSRTAPVTADPTVNVTLTKQQRMVAAAAKYVAAAKLPQMEMFFDVLTVVFDGEKTEVEYFPQAFIPIYY